MGHIQFGMKRLHIQRFESLSGKQRKTFGLSSTGTRQAPVTRGFVHYIGRTRANLCWAKFSRIFLEMLQTRKENMTSSPWLLRNVWYAERYTFFRQSIRILSACWVVHSSASLTWGKEWRGESYKLTRITVTPAHQSSVRGWHQRTLLS